MLECYCKWNIEFVGNIYIYIYNLLSCCFLMAVLPLVPKTKIADVGKLISLGNLLVREVTCLVLTTTSSTLILSRAFGADCMTRIAYIYSRFPSTHSLSHSHLLRQHTHCLSLSLPPSLSLSLSLLHFDFQQSTP